MPIMDGNKATTKIREHIYSKMLDQPIICGCTGHVEESYVQRSIESGMNQVFSKPISIDLLKKTLEKLNFLWTKDIIETFIIINLFCKYV